MLAKYKMVGQMRPAGRVLETHVIYILQSIQLQLTIYRHFTNAI